ncbi:MAG: TetR/AcrR family transcriptional regulator [Acidimicrobiales bacterium]
MSELRQARLPAAQRRTQLLEVALELFGARGFHLTAMDDIAEVAGVTKPVLYQHFASKQQLYRELIERVGGDLVEALAAAASAEASPSARVQAGFRAYFTFVCERTSAFELLFGGGAQRTEEFAEAIRAVEERAASTIAQFIDADIDDDHRELLGFAVVGAAEVASRQWVMRAEEAAGTPPDLDPAEGTLLANRLADVVWAGLRSLPGDRGHR